MKEHNFDHKAIEQKWQEKWQESGIYNISDRDPSKEKEYVLVEWPYPSGNLHIGHWYAFAVPDIYVRMRRMQGVQALFPMGFDAFGLPAENAAIKRSINPREWTESNIKHMRTQLTSMGNAFSWDKTASSTDLNYYKWTQWMFTEFFKHDIAYRGMGVVNWDPIDQTVLANEQVLPDGTAERSGAVVEKREMPQWMFRITKYADRLIDDLEPLDWPDHIKEAQRQWIGRSEGARIPFTLSTDDVIEVFTTRPDTLFGATHLVFAPEHDLIKKKREQIENWEEVSQYIETARKKSEQDRLDMTKEKTGVKVEGITAINPVNGEEIPVYVSDYVLMGYGTGVIMAVPAHDERDYAFAQKFDIPIKDVIMCPFELEGDRAIREDTETLHRTVVDAILKDEEDNFYLIKEPNGDVHLIGGAVEEGESEREALKREVTEESGFTELTVHKKATTKVWCRGYRITKEKNQCTQGYGYEVILDSNERVNSEVEEGRHELVKVTRDELLDSISKSWPGHRFFVEQYLKQMPIYTGNGTLINSDEFDGMNSEEAKDAITEKVSGKKENTYRLRDWSVGRQRYWGVPIPVVYDPEGIPHPIPLEHLPWTLPADVDFKPTGEPPLAKSKELKERTERIFGEGWTPEVETMDTFLDSSWYFLRYIDNQNDECASSMERQKEWMPVDIYFGGAEHTTMHLLYSRFWQKALYDLGHVKDHEPYRKRINRGLILGPDGNKMSKSKGNIIDPDEQLERVGADAVKMYLAFMGPYQGSNYPWDMGGIAGIRRFLERIHGLSEHIQETEDIEVTRALHKTIQKVNDDIEVYKFNTAISALMVLTNTIERSGCTEETYKNLLRLLAPFAPHLAEELWERAGEAFSIHDVTWPDTKEELLVDEEVTLGVQIDGKMRGTVVVPSDASEDNVLEAVRADKNLSTRVQHDGIERVIYVPGKIINIIQKKK